MDRRRFIKRMAAAVVGVGLLGSELMARAPEWEAIAWVEAGSGMAGVTTVEGIDFETGTITVNTSAVSPLGADDYVFLANGS